MDEMDEIGQELDRVLRVALTGAGQLAERVARRSQERLRESQRVAGEQARALREQVQGEMQAARLVYRPAAEPRWWDAAGPQDVAQAWGTANAWKDYDPQARAAEQLIREGVGKKWPTATVEDLLRGRPTVPAGLRDIGEDLANGLADLEQARTDRADAAEREDQTDELRTKVQAEDHGQAQALTRETGGYDADADRLEEHAAPLVERRPSEYSRATERELVDVSSTAAKKARLDSAPGFGRPTKAAMTGTGKSTRTSGARRAPGQSDPRPGPRPLRPG